MKDQIKLVAYALAVTGDAHLAEDVAQEAISLALQNRGQFNDERHLLAWLRETTRRKGLETMRRLRRDRTFDQRVLELLEESWANLEAGDAADRLDALRHCLRLVSPYARRVLQARYGQGLTGNRLAAAMGRNLNTVYVALSRTHQMLAECVRRRLAEGAPRG